VAKLIDDFRYGVENLPEKQEEVGRPTKYAAEAYTSQSFNSFRLMNRMRTTM